MTLTTSFVSTALSLFLFTSSGQKQTSDSFEDRAAKGNSIMTEVIHRFHINYEMSRTHKIGYYQEAMEDVDGVHYLAESIVDIFVPHNLSQAEHASIKPLRARKKVFEDVKSEDVLFGNASDMARCSIWRPSSFLNDRHRDDYNFLYTKDSLFHRTKVFAIEFTPATSKGDVSGTILVDKESYAILHIDYSPNMEDDEFWSKVVWTEEFYFTEGKYELSKVKFEGLCSENTYEYSATLVMQHLKVLTEIPEHPDYLDKDGSIFDHASDDFTESFWNGYQELKKDVEAEHVVHLATN